MGCREFNMNGTALHTYPGAWVAYGGDWYTDESINSNIDGCTWWGEEYTGQVILDTY